MKILVFANQKGGSGKTTTVINVGDALARMGKKILILDLDPRGHAAVSLNLDPEAGVANWLLHSLFNTAPLTPEIVSQWIRTTRRENLFVLPGNQMTARAQRFLTLEEKPINYIKDCLPAIRRLGFDYLLFDTPPSTGGLQEMAAWSCRPRKEWKATGTTNRMPTRGPGRRRFRSWAADLPFRTMS